VLRRFVELTPESGHCFKAYVSADCAKSVLTRRNKKVHGSRGGLGGGRGRGALGEARQPHQHVRNMPPVISTIVMLRLFARCHCASI